MKQYLALLDHVLTRGVKKSDRTGVGTLAVFGYQMRFDLAEGFPLVTTKKMHTKSIIYELLWFLRGDTDIKYLQEHGVTIWDEWANEHGYVGPLYGKQWRKWDTRDKKIDQIRNLIKQIKENPDSRRLLVSAWNVGELTQMRLPPCHFAFQCQVINGKLNLHVFLRSLDIFLGAPFDIASYAFLLCILADICNLERGELLVTSTDTHLYLNHIDQAKLQLTRTPYQRPLFELSRAFSGEIDDLVFEDFIIKNYLSHESIKAPIAV